MSEKEDRFEVWLDEGAIIIDFNNTASILSGYSKNEVIGQNWFELFIEDDNILEVLTIFNNLFNKNNLSWKYTNSIICKNGTRKTFSWENNIIIDKKAKHKLIHSLGKEI